MGRPDGICTHEPHGGAGGMPPEVPAPAERSVVAGPRMEHFDSLKSDAVLSCTTVEISVGVPAHVVDRMEVYNDSSFFDVEVLARGDDGKLTSLFSRGASCAAGAFWPGNAALFNRALVSGREVVVQVTNVSGSARMFRGALFGKARTD